MMWLLRYRVELSIALLVIALCQMSSHPLIEIRFSSNLNDSKAMESHVDSVEQPSSP